MSATTPSSTHSQIHALLDIYQNLSSRYNPSKVTFKLEICNDADLSSDDIVWSQVLCSPTGTVTASGNHESLAVQSSRINNSSMSLRDRRDAQCLSRLLIVPPARS
ncbi:hypothetical protein LIPSTDRAFT_68863 [Lipomyces starkeyi NRRL Y-11557]|uniref:Uncharacterized protein n=1 Tax=Lipomyces starkeyi NRRL Y-11557 TaxID=675824 RepID=A0A1E3QB77_LIPST|nr:hypothetical protein LIPSTDRAFT_68863 [Lipomyces starkeyi NRRL Y-11557]